jgi:hypothetical protein
MLTEALYQIYIIAYYLLKSFYVLSLWAFTPFCIGFSSVIRWRRMSWAGHVAHMEEMRFSRRTLLYGVRFFFIIWWFMLKVLAIHGL